MNNFSIYKYLPNDFADNFITKGEVLFRPLTYFIKEFNEKITLISDIFIFILMAMYFISSI